jgi:hypothetical protein
MHTPKDPSPVPRPFPSQRAQECSQSVVHRLARGARDLCVRQLRRASLQLPLQLSIVAWWHSPLPSAWPLNHAIERNPLIQALPHLDGVIRFVPILWLGGRYPSQGFRFAGKVRRAAWPSSYCTKPKAGGKVICPPPFPSAQARAAQITGWVSTCGLPSCLTLPLG